MEENYWVNVTEEIQGCQKGMKLLELIKDDDVTLQQCMQSQEINDDKMDPKFDISQKSTIQYYLSQKKIKLPHQLTPEQIGTIFANVFQLQSAILKGNSLPSTIYTFSYLYDEIIYQESVIFKALIESIHSIGSHVYCILKDSCSVKEDDVNISSMAYIKNSKSHQQVIELILEAQKFCESQSKKTKQKVHFPFIIACLRLRRMLHSFAKSSGSKYDHNKSKKIQEDLQSIKKKLTALQDIPYDENREVPNIFFKQMSKVLRAHFGPRQSPKISFKCSLQQIKNTIEQFQLFFPLPNKIHDYKNKLQILQSKPYNVWSKSYIKSNIFAKQDYVFSYYKTDELLVNDINDWVHLKDTLKTSDKFHEFVKSAAQVISETLYRLLGNNMRWQWECSKVYEDYNVIVHMANEMDLQITAPNRQLFLCSYFYYYGLSLMIKQMLVGFQIRIYHPNQAKSVFYVLENLLGVFDRNSQIYLRKIDKAFLANFMEGNFNKKLKKKMTENSKRMFADILFKKGLHLYFKSLFRIISVLHYQKQIPNQFEETQQIRVQNRFRIFKKILFLKVIEYPEYCKVVEEVCKRSNQFITQAINDLKQMKDIFQLFVAQFDENELFLNQKSDAELLIKSSIKASLAAMSLKMNAKNKNYQLNFESNYPEISMK